MPQPPREVYERLTPLQQLHLRVKREFDQAEATLGVKGFQALLEITRHETEIRLARLAVLEAERYLSTESES